MTDDRGTGKITKGSCYYFPFISEERGASCSYKETAMKRSGASRDERAETPPLRI
jgi:hypothetical protein